MVVEYTSAAVALFYAANIPVKLALCVHSGSRPALGVGLFESRFAVQSAKPSRHSGEKTDPAFLQSLLRRAIKRVHVDSLRLTGRLGTGDAMDTALLCGSLESLCRTLGAAFGSRVTVRLRPEYSQTVLEGEFHCILSASAGHIILAALCGGAEFLKRRVLQWIRTPSKTS